MSTSYYYFNSPITSIRLEEGPAHDLITIFENHANCGTLTVSKGTGRTICLMFALNDVDDFQCPIHTHWGGSKVGAVITENVNGLSDDLILISEYGEPMSVKQIRALAGHVRKDGMPGELFGYNG